MPPRRFPPPEEDEETFDPLHADERNFLVPFLFTTIEPSAGTAKADCCCRFAGEFGAEASMLAAHLNDVKHWRDRAAETRVLSTTMKDIEIQAIMTRLADHYDTLADWAEARANGTAVIERLIAKAAQY
jgi:hypothetical protein